MIGTINTPVSGNAVATNAALAIAPGAEAPPQIPVSGLTTAFGLGGFNRFNHAWNSIQGYDDAFLTRGTRFDPIWNCGRAHAIQRLRTIESERPHERVTLSLTSCKTHPHQLNALAPGGSP